MSISVVSIETVHIVTVVRANFWFGIGILA